MTDEVVRYRDDSPDGELVDDMVTDALMDAKRHADLATATVRRITSDPRLKTRYGDFDLELKFSGTDGRVARADLHRALRDKGMSTREIAAQTGASQSTVMRDTTEPSGSPDEAESEPSGSPEPEAQPDTGIEVTAEDEERHPKVAATRLSAAIAKGIREVKTDRLDPNDWADRMDELRADDIAALRSKIDHVGRWLKTWQSMIKATEGPRRVK